MKYVFGVSRQAFASWGNGTTPVPYDALLALLGRENCEFQGSADRLADIKRMAEQLNSGEPLRFKGKI